VQESGRCDRTFLAAGRYNGRMNLPTDPATLRRSLYVLLIVVAVSGIAGRIIGVGRVYEPWLSRDPNRPEDTRGNWPATRPEPQPTHGDNDRSRWDTVRALVENHTYAIGHRPIPVALSSAVAGLAAADLWQAAALQAAGSDARIKSDTGIVVQDGWKTIDKVMNPQTQEFYSSKPPLLPTMVAGEYWVFHKGLGWSLTDERHRWEIVPAILLTLNALPWAVALWLLACVVDRHGSTDWGRFFVLAAAGFATFVTTFSVTLNNHTVAAWAAMIALYAAMRIWSAGSGGAPFYLYPLAGFFAAFTACNELPAAAFAVALFLMLLWESPRRTLAGFLPASLLPVVAFFLTNYLAIGELNPAYEKFGGPWYDYEGSYWRSAKGIDTAGMQESRGVYAFHLLLGHHGAFSLTPIFLLSLVGMLVLLRYAKPALFGEAKEDDRRGLALAGLLALGVTVVVLAFYILFLDERKRNYGGWTSGPRWLIWLTPLWLVALLPAADWLGRRRWGRVVGYALLALSVVSVSYPQYSPWRHPWLYNFLEAHGLVKY
jgi:hypothetical protein